MALAAAAIVLVIAAWFDSTFIRGALREAQSTFDMAGFAGIPVLGSMLVAGSVLLLGTLAWRAASVVVGITYVVVGGFVVALPWLVMNLASSTNDAPPVLPETLASAITSIWTSTAGSLNAVGTIGAAMLIAGVAALVRWWRGRAIAPSSPGVVAPTTDPTLS